MTSSHSTKNGERVPFLLQNAYTYRLPIIERFTGDKLREDYNKVNKAIGAKKKADRNDPCTVPPAFFPAYIQLPFQEEVNQKTEIDAKIKQAETEEGPILDQLNKLIGTIGNLVHDSVPVDNNEDNNKVERTWGEIPDIKVNSTPGKCHHHEILAMIDGYDPKRGQKVAGHRGFFLKGPGALLNLALVNYGIQFLAKKGYTPVQTPYFMKKSIMSETCQLSDFDDQLYKISGSKGEEDSYLIATSEQPISGFFRGEWLDTKELPIKFGGYSTCFRKEAGASGKDTWGIFRVHQFEKIEQFIITAPVSSYLSCTRLYVYLYRKNLGKHMRK